jgi:hypothetical protein
MSDPRPPRPDGERPAPVNTQPAAPPPRGPDLSAYGPDGRRRVGRRRTPAWVVQGLVLVVVLAVVGLALYGPDGETGGPGAYGRADQLVFALSAAVQQYRSAYGAYPPDAGGGVHPDLDRPAERLVYYLSGRSLAYDAATVEESFPWLHPVFRDATPAGTGRRSLPSFYAFRPDELVDTDRDGVPEVADPWKRPLHYRSTNPAHNTTTFDLWSTGRDGASGSNDDVGNW